MAKAVGGVCKTCGHAKGDHNFFLGSEDRSCEVDKCGCSGFME